jgi:hypothetical protein
MGGIHLRRLASNRAIYSGRHCPRQRELSGMDNPHQQRRARLGVDFVGGGTAAPTIWLCYIVLHWEKVSRRAYDRIASSPYYMFLINANGLFLRVNIGWSLFCAIPLWIMITKCTSLSQYPSLSQFP